MSALTSVARTGATTRGSTLFCTTFPCHSCAKHLAAAGIARVVFVEPYPKSKARDLHADAIELVGETLEGVRMSALTASVATARTRFEPFLGVGPRRYFDLFSMRLGTGRSMARKDDQGDALKFEPSEATPRIPLATTTYLEEEIEAAGFVEDAKQLMRKPERVARPKPARRKKAKGKRR
jgi:cytidine deaminase